MTLPEQAAVLVEAVEQELLQQEDIVRWADETIVTLNKPPAWVIDLSVLTSPHLVDSVAILREQAARPLSLHRRVQVVVLAYLAGELSLDVTLSKLFRVVIFQRQGMERDPLDERLTDTLVEWDFQDDLSVIEPPLREKFEALFREYMTDKQDVAKVLPWRQEV
jgi:hypothetical protein